MRHRNKGNTPCAHRFERRQAEHETVQEFRPHLLQSSNEKSRARRSAKQAQRQRSTMTALFRRFLKSEQRHSLPKSEFGSPPPASAFVASLRQFDDRATRDALA